MSDEAVVVNGGSGRGPRSPNFPAISLSDALGKARTLYEKDRRAWTSISTVLSHLGFSAKLSGSTARVISAMRQFGLIEQNDKLVRVSDAVVRVLTLSDGAPERSKALRDCVLKPQIYREIFNEYPEGLPSDEALKDYLLVQKKFNPDSVDTFLRVFRASTEFAKVSPTAYAGANSQETEELQQTPQQGTNQPGPTPAVTGLQSGTGVSREVSSLLEGEAMLQWPATLSADSVQELEDWLDLVIRKLKRRVKTEP